MATNTIGESPNIHIVNSHPLMNPIIMPPKNIPIVMNTTDSFEEKTSSKDLVY